MVTFLDFYLLIFSNSIFCLPNPFKNQHDIISSQCFQLYFTHKLTALAKSLYVMKSVIPHWKIDIDCMIILIVDKLEDTVISHLYMRK